VLLLLCSVWPLLCGVRLLLLCGVKPLLLLCGVWPLLLYGV
jgi:hypothetical protein